MSLEGTHYFNISLMGLCHFSTPVPKWYLGRQLETVIIAGLLSFYELCLFAKKILVFACIRLTKV